MKSKLFLLGILFSSSVLCQQTPDNQAWLSFTLKKDLSKKTQVAVSLNHRRDENIIAMSSSFTEIEVSRDITKWFTTSLAWRCSIDPDAYFTNRLDWNNAFDYEIADFTFSYRIRLQASREPENYIEYRIRNKVECGYKVNKHWAVSIEAEPFYTIQYNYQNWDALRFGGGIDYRISKRKRVSVFIKRQNQYNVAEPSAKNIFGVGYKYELK